MSMADDIRTEAMLRVARVIEEERVAWGTAKGIRAHQIVAALDGLLATQRVSGFLGDGRKAVRYATDWRVIEGDRQ